FTIPDYTLFDGGVFAYFKYKKDKISICGGVRSDIRKVKFDDFYLQHDSLTGFDSQVQDTTNSTLQFPSYSKLFNGLSASMGLSYFFNNNVSLKANIGRGFRAPNITEIASNGLDPGARLIYLGNRNFVAEFSLQEDLALLFNFKNVSAEISIFNNHVQNFIYLSLVADSNGNAVLDAQNNRTYQYKQSKAQLYGLETWFAIHPSALPQFRFNTSLALVYGRNREEKYRNKGIEGEFLPLIPPLKSMSSIAYKFLFNKSILKAIAPTIEFEYNAAQNRYLAVNNSETSTPSYSLVNVQLSFEFMYCKDKNIQLQTQVNNVFDVAYQSHLSRLKYFENYQQTPNNRPGIYSMGRNFCLKMIVPF
ncbi:MAG: TonB-dependent receptor, partial [Crocinitomicaceae bacterium]|nr:TonB-dependent receptor [Crocinitomicaceae bacterium]